ncbi:hypothetical protein EDC04DRAFT_238892 [Pisolithus marmoratus]|nr:hypothetical protein EDC04DRAFT_238892 [Pisolithus marmoratus]
MNSDATEAALGLLGLSPLNHHIQVFDAHSVPSLIPLKRKQPSPTNDNAKTHLAKLAKPLLTTTFSHPPITSPHPSLLSPTTLRPPSLLPHRPSPLSSQPHHSKSPDPPLATDADDISCICGFTYDDGFSIACDVCSRWCHAACFGIVEGGVPEEWRCWVCQGGSINEEQRERAVKLQRKRLKTMKMRNGSNGNVPHADHVTGEDQPAKPTSRRRTSPGVEKKPRRSSAVTGDGTAANAPRKRRRASILSPAGPSNLASALAVPNANHVTSPDAVQPSSSRISQPSRVTDVFPPDVHPHPSTHARLLKVARAWRGVTALNPPIPLVPPKAYVDGGYVRVDGQGYKDRHGYSMSPLDNTTPVIVDDDVNVVLPPTVLKTCPSNAASYSCSHTGASGSNSVHTPPHLLRPPSPKLFVGSARLTQPLTTSGPAGTSGAVSGKASHGPTNHSSNDGVAIPSNTLLSPYTATILPSSAYLADPLNGYAHLGMGKPQVRLVGGGWCVGVDARELGGRGTTSNVYSSNKGKGACSANEAEERVGGTRQKGKGAAAADGDLGKARWARCGCWPNAVVRPVICGGGRRRKKKGEGGGRESDKENKARRHRDGCSSSTTPTTTSMNGNGEDDSDVPPPPPSPSDGFSNSDDTSSDEDSTTLSFGLFALRDLRADEEIVLGWEWDDGHAVHMLPALIESPGMFGPAHLRHLRSQFTSILHALSSTFTTCACGSSTRDCAVRVMERVVEGKWPWPGSETSGSEWESGDDQAGGSGDCDGRIMGVGQGRERDEEDVIVDLEATDSEGEGARGMNGVTVNCKRTSAGGANSTKNPSSQRRRRKKTKERNHAENNRHIDLGPLVGVQRGFRTREREPMSGGCCGVEVVPSSLGWSAGLAENEDMDVDVVGNGGSRCQRTNARGKKDKKCSKAARNGELHAVENVLPGKDHILPPRMRKPWAQQLAGPSRSPTATHAESPVSATGHWQGQGQGWHEADGTSAMETEFDTETEGEDTADDTRQMPPPPMPASLDPTTVSSLAHAHAQSFAHHSPVVRSSSPHHHVSSTPPVPNTSTRNLPDTPSIVPPRWLPSRTPPTPNMPIISPRTSSPPTPSDLPIAPVSATAAVQASVPASSSALTSAQQLLQPAMSQPQPQQQPLPPYIHTLASMSPSVPFSKLSLLSPDGGTAISQSGGRAVSLSSISSERSTVEKQPPSASTDVPSYFQAQSHWDGVIPPAAHPDYSQEPDDKHASSIETHRVRFVSPEVLGGLPPLASVGQDVNGVQRDVEDEVDVVGGVDGLDGITIDTNTGRNELGQVNEALDVDVSGDVSEHFDGEHPAHRSGDTSPRTDAPSLSGPHDEQPQPPPESVNVPPEPETLHTEPHSPHTATPHQSEPEPEPRQPARVPSPPPPPKVKMSLKDFVLRKKKQREEEMAAKVILSPASPSTHLALPPSPGPGGDEIGSTGVEPAEATITPDERVCGRGERQISATVPDVDLKGDEDPNTVGAAGDIIHMLQDHIAPREITQMSLDLQESSSSNEPESCQQATVIADGCQSSPPPLPPLTPLRVPDESQAIQTQTKGSPAADQPSTEKFDVREHALPNGATGADDRLHDVVSFAPDPPPPPLNSLAASTNHVDSGTSTSVAPPPTPTPTPSSMSTSSTSNSRATSVSTSTPSHQSQYLRATYQGSATSRRVSHEDGEILNSASSKSYVPRSHTPPTQPRSFQAPRPPSPGYSPGPSSSRRPQPPPPPRPGSGPGPSSVSTNALPRPLPSGPRALRGSMNQSSYTHPSSYPPPPPRPYSGSQYIPRGPSADRDRLDRERDRSWSASSRPRGRAGSNGWGR